LAFFGAYALLNFAMFWYALPKLRGVSRFKPALAIAGFWIMSLAVLGLGVAMAIAGILQVYIERVMGQGFMNAQLQMQFWFKIVLFFGVVLLAGLAITIWTILTGKQLPPEAAEA
jgi:nitric oxide reductase subunit B